MSEPTLDVRENWGTRTGFVLAAIGSAVGLGNLWGFPYKLYSYGGGAFLIPYFIGMLVVGIPVLILEFSLGHMTQKAAPDAFRGVARRSEVIGWLGILLGFVIITYYAVVLAWCLKYLVISVQGIFNGGELPWADQGLEGITKAKSYFLSGTLNVWGDDHAGKPWQLGPISSPMVWCLLATWAMIFLCIFRGVKLVSKIVLWTVPLPWLMLVVLVVRGLTLPGASDGLEYYLQPDWSQLAKPTTWRFAFAQVFFSMSLAFGVMLTYASFLHRKSDINNNAAIIGLGDLATSFIAGIAVFATLGGMAHVTGGQVTDVAAGGPGLAFVVFPYALAQFPHSAWFSAIFFFALITLGIDSAFSIVESVLASIVDKLKCNRLMMLIVLCAVAFAIGAVYCTRGGLTWLGSMDDYINGPMGIVFVGLLQCLALGWSYRIARLRHHANERSDWRLGPWWDWMIRLLIPMLLSALFIWMMLDTAADPTFFKDGETWNLPHLVWLAIALLAPLLAVALSALRSEGANIHADDQEHAVGARGRGGFGVAVALISLALVAGGFVFAVRARMGYSVETGLDVDGLAAAISAARLLAASGVLAFASLVAGTAGVVASEANRRRPSRLARAGAALSVFSLGSLLGLAVALVVMRFNLDAAGESVRTSSGHMSGMSYAIMAVTLLLIFGGLMLCFTMAMRAAGRDDTDQDAEDPSATEMN